MKRKILSIMIAGVLSLSIFTGCGNSTSNNKVEEKVKEGANDLKEGAEKVGNSIEDLVKDLETNNYKTGKLAKKLQENGYNVTYIKSDYTSNGVKSDKYELLLGNGDQITVLDYNDVNNVTTVTETLRNNGLNGETVEYSWRNEPRFYNKDEILVVYDGNDQKVIDLLKSELGDSIVIKDANK